MTTTRNPAPKTLPDEQLAAAALEYLTEPPTPERVAAAAFLARPMTHYTESVRMEVESAKQAVLRAKARLLQKEWEWAVECLKACEALGPNLEAWATIYKESAERRHLWWREFCDEHGL